MAEDNAVNQKIGRQLLENMGATVIVVDTARAVINYLLTSTVDAVLMDCQMRELDGYDATRLIREGAGGAHSVRIPIIAASALAGERAQCLAAGMNDHLTKPIDVAALQVTIGRLLMPNSNANPHFT